MASMKAERPVGSQSLFGQPKKETIKINEGASKPTGSKQAPKKAEQKPKENKRKAKGGKPAAKK